MKRVSVAAASVALGLVAVLGVAAPSTAASTVAASSTQEATETSAEIDFAAACVVGIEYWQTSQWNPVQGYVNYYANAKNCSSANKRVQFMQKGSGAFGGCYTIKPGQTKTLQSTSAFNGYREC